MGASFPIKPPSQVPSNIVFEYDAVRNNETVMFALTVSFLWLPVFGFSWIPLVGWPLVGILIIVMLVINSIHYKNIIKYRPSKIEIVKSSRYLLFGMLFLTVIACGFQILHQTVRVSRCRASALNLNNLPTISYDYRTMNSTACRNAKSYTCPYIESGASNTYSDRRDKFGIPVGMTADMIDPNIVDNAITIQYYNGGVSYTYYVGKRFTCRLSYLSTTAALMNTIVMVIHAIQLSLYSVTYSSLSSFCRRVKHGKERPEGEVAEADTIAMQPHIQNSSNPYPPPPQQNSTNYPVRLPRPQTGISGYMHGIVNNISRSLF